MPKSNSKGRELLAEWVAALESGEWKQTTRAFKKRECFCAGGVLLDLICDRWELDDLGILVAKANVEGQEKALWSDVLKKCFGLDEVWLYGRFENDWTESIAYANDRLRLDFHTIARAIARYRDLTPAEIDAAKARLIASGVLKECSE